MFSSVHLDSSWLCNAHKTCQDLCWSLMDFLEKVSVLPQYTDFLYHQYTDLISPRLRSVLLLSTCSSNLVIHQDTLHTNSTPLWTHRQAPVVQGRGNRRQRGEMAAPAGPRSRKYWTPALAPRTGLLCLKHEQCLQHPQHSTAIGTRQSGTQTKLLGRVGPHQCAHLQEVPSLANLGVPSGMLLLLLQLLQFRVILTT